MISRIFNFSTIGDEKVVKRQEDSLTLTVPRSAGYLFSFGSTSHTFDIMGIKTIVKQLLISKNTAFPSPDLRSGDTVIVNFDVGLALRTLKQEELAATFGSQGITFVSTEFTVLDRENVFVFHCIS